MSLYELSRIATGQPACDVGNKLNGHHLTANFAIFVEDSLFIIIIKLSNLFTVTKYTINRTLHVAINENHFLVIFRRRFHESPLLLPISLQETSIMNMVDSTDTTKRQNLQYLFRIYLLKLFFK